MEKSKAAIKPFLIVINNIPYFVVGHFMYNVITGYLEVGMAQSKQESLLYKIGDIEVRKEDNKIVVSCEEGKLARFKEGEESYDLFDNPQENLAFSPFGLMFSTRMFSYFKTEKTEKGFLS
jgi:hypothetical protein